MTSALKKQGATTCLEVNAVYGEGIERKGRTSFTRRTVRCKQGWGMAGEIRHGFLSVFALMVSILERPLEWMVSPLSQYQHVHCTIFEFTVAHVNLYWPIRLVYRAIESATVFRVYLLKRDTMSGTIQYLWRKMHLDTLFEFGIAIQFARFLERGEGRSLYLPSSCACQLIYQYSISCSRMNCNSIRQ